MPGIVQGWGYKDEAATVLLLSGFPVVGRRTYREVQPHEITALGVGIVLHDSGEERVYSEDGRATLG